MALEEFKLDGKVAVVTGNGRGVGYALALALAEAGADVVVASHTTREGEKTVEAIRGLGRKAMLIPTDVTKLPEIEGMAKRVLLEFGRIDILVNSPEVEFAKPALDMTEEEWHRVMDTNLTSIFLCSKVVGKQMMEQGGGKIINMASGLAERGLRNATAYCASKAGVVLFTKALSLELIPYNIRVNAIGPGWLTDSATAKGQDALWPIIPMRRRGEPSELGGALVYLASEASSYMVGETLYIDGGLLPQVDYTYKPL